MQCKYAAGGSTKRRTRARHDAKQCICYGVSQSTHTHPATASVTSALTGKADTTFDADGQISGGEFIDVQSEEPAGDWAHIFQRFNLDPDVFAIVDDTVRCSTWQQSKALDNGTRDVVNLYSYRARFTRRQASGIDLAGITKHLRSWKPSTSTRTKLASKPLTLFVGWADWQLGKGEGDGTKGTTQRLLDSFDKTVDRVHQLRRQGLNVNSLLLGNMGDHTEAVTGHYTSQTYSVDLNQRDQLNLAIELNLTGIKALAPLFDEVTYAACLCNHGQWQRLGGKQFTDDADNSTGFIGDTLKTVCNLHPDLAGMNWNIPRENMITTGTFSGVNVAMGHGHKISGNEEVWLNRQSAWLQTQERFAPDLWITAHRHTADLHDYGPYHRIQCTTEDPGSKSFTDGTGKFSTRGTTTALIGLHNERRFSHYEVL